MHPLYFSASEIGETRHSAEWDPKHTTNIGIEKCLHNVCVQCIVFVSSARRHSPQSSVLS